MDEMKYTNKDMDAAKRGLADSSKIKAAAEGNLGVTKYLKKHQRFGQPTPGLHDQR